MLTTQAVFLISTLVSAFFTGERRIRVHTLALPITNKLADLYATADVQAIATLLAKMGESALLDSFVFVVRPIKQIKESVLKLTFRALAIRQSTHSL